ncbi:MAG: PEP-CTERM sorting domain-containing protein [Oscillatoriales cyanobacterium C42_A2020_001]|nr:PEP-CTERM sorting domain-containing protein [Leptolyngbyaceae cyanobacterium C42_A2020_001]
MIKKTLSLLTSAAVIVFSGGSAWGFSLVGSELRLRTEAQSSPTSQLFVTSFPASAIVSESAVEFPNVESLFDPTVGVPSGFARSLVDVAIDAGSNYLEIDFDNAGSGLYASGFKNTYVFTFTAPIALQITDVAIDPLTTLGLTADRVTFNGNELFVNVQRLSFNRNSFARLNLTTVAIPNPDNSPLPDSNTEVLPESGAAAVPEPATLLGIALAGSGLAYLKRRRSV